MRSFRFVALAVLISMAVQTQFLHAHEVTEEEEKAIQEQLDSIMHTEAVKAINDTAFTTCSSLFFIL